MVASTLILAAGAATPDDSIRFELVTRATQSTGWEIAVDEMGKTFDRDLRTGAADPSKGAAFTAARGTFDFVRNRLARYRKLARDGAGCPIGTGDVISYRLTWTEHGLIHTATFADSCGGVPSDLFNVLAPVGQRIDRALPPPQHDTVDEDP